MTACAVSSEAWHVAQTQPRREARAAEELKNQGFRVFLPRYLRRRRHARQITTAPAPLFPGYLFVAFDAAIHRWRSINGTIGIVRLVTTLDRPALVPHGVVEGLVARCDPSGYIPLRSRPAFTPGEPVRVSGGNFAEALGLFAEVRDHDRIAILIELLGRKVRVLIDDDLVERAA